MTSYFSIFERFLSKIDSTEYAQISRDDLTSILKELLDTALDTIEAEGISMVSNLTNRNDMLLEFSDTLAGCEIEAISLYMVAAWYEPKVNSLEHTSMFFGGKDEKWNNQKDHFKTTASIQEGYINRARKLFRDYYYKNRIKKGNGGN